jgi:hypothetical protein
MVCIEVGVTQEVQFILPLELQGLTYMMRYLIIVLGEQKQSFKPMVMDVSQSKIQPHYTLNSFKPDMNPIILELVQ